MKTYRAISADSHVNEPPDMFRKFFPTALRDRAPHLVELDNGGQAWAIEDTPDPIPFSTTAVNYRAQKRFDRSNYKDKFLETRDGIKRGVRYDDILPGSWDPKARLKEQDEDNVDAEVMYCSPMVWGGVKAIKDRQLKLACFRAYNDWMAEFCSQSPDRLIGVGLVPVTGIEDAVAETRRCIEELKLKTVALESYPSGSYFQPTPEDDRFWEVALELGIAVSLHLSINVPPDAATAFLKGRTTDLRQAIESGHFSRVFENLVVTGVFDRFPDLIFVGAEVNGGWIPYYLESFDRNIKRHPVNGQIKLDLTPSEYFARNAYITYILDQVCVNNRYTIGVDRMMWSTDFPHSVSNWPIDVELAHSQLERGQVPKDEWERLMWRTCADLYQLPYDMGTPHLSTEAA